MRGSVFKRGRTWTYVLSLGRESVSGKKRQRWVGGFKTKADAELALTRALVAEDGGVTVVTTTIVKVAQFLDEWLEAVRPSLKATTAKSYSEMMQGYVAPRIGDVRLARLNPGHLRALYGELLTSCSCRVRVAGSRRARSCTRTGAVARLVRCGAVGLAGGEPGRQGSTRRGLCHPRCGSGRLRTPADSWGSSRATAYTRCGWCFWPSACVAARSPA